MEALSRNGERGAPLTQSYYARHAIQLAPAIEVSPLSERRVMIRCPIVFQIEGKMHSNKNGQTLYNIYYTNIFYSLHGL